MTDSRLLKYQSLFLEGPETNLKVCGNLNPATFLPEKENETPDHNCSQFLTLNYAAREDLMDIPLDNLDMEIFTDGSSFVWDGKCKAGYAMVTAEQILEAKSIPQGTSAQLVELVALTRALLLLSLQSCLTLRDPMDRRLPGFSVHGIFQARVLEWGAIAFSGLKP